MVRGVSSEVHIHEHHDFEHNSPSEIHTDDHRDWLPNLIAADFYEGQIDDTYENTNWCQKGIKHIF